jgi:osmotically inducible lipoprotein OsmB
MTAKQLLKISILSVTLFGIVGCAGEPLSTREKGTLIGGVAGAGGGALIGAAVGHPGAGAAIGGLGGAATGYAIGNHEQNEQDRSYYRDRE